ncbi:putative phage replication protein [Escherichia coli M056]|uniref:transcriptional regulator n=1 Tax=Escherichia coli TaxID=562 RepID=UPI000A18975D|nr:transcriptional regulator [Escherichia coli]OSK23658.1 putative phage replication protein [Escherichia coli M056]
MNCFQFVTENAFGNPIQRLIMLRVLMSGSSDGEGERIIDHQVLADFCCCSKQAMFKEILALEKAGCLHVREIATFAIDAKTRLQPARGYTITMSRKEVL